MKFLCKFFIIFLICVTPGFASSETGTLPYEMALLDLINAARTNPADTITSMELSYGEADLYSEKLNPVVFNEKLYNSASAHTSDMVENNYFSQTSQNGTTYAERITSTGYLSVRSGEVIGILAFENYIDPNEAVKLIFERLMKEELDPLKDAERNILDPEFTDVGISFGFGSMVIGGKPFNTYLVTCDFGVSRVSAIENRLLAMINQVRANPLDAARALGFDPEAVLSELPELHDALLNGMEPLVFNESLFAAASSHAADMYENDFYSEFSSEGATVYDRIVESGYSPTAWSESRRLFSSVDYADPEVIAVSQFEKLLSREFQGGEVIRNILNPELKEIGIRFLFAPPDPDVGLEDSYQKYYTYMLVCDFGKPVDNEDEYHFSGLVFADTIPNDYLDIGEGSAGVPVQIIGMEMEHLTFTDQNGYFDIPLHPGQYAVLIGMQSDVMEGSIKMGEGNMFQSFEVGAESSEET